MTSIYLVGSVPSLKAMVRVQRFGSFTVLFGFWLDVTS